MLRRTRIGCFGLVIAIIVLSALHQSQSSLPLLSSINVQSSSVRLKDLTSKTWWASGSSSAQGYWSSTFDSKGLLSVDLTQKSVEHPISTLIRLGKAQARSLEEKRASILTVEDAVDDYVNAFAMQPPRGFGDWFEFNQIVNAHSASSLIPLVHSPFELLLSHDAQVMRERVRAAEENPHWGIYTITMVPDGTGDEGTACGRGQVWTQELASSRGRGRVRVRGTAAWSSSCYDTLSVLIPMLMYLPDAIFSSSPPFSMAISKNDNPGVLVHHWFKERCKALSREGKVWDEHGLWEAQNVMSASHGWSWACPDGSPLQLAKLGIEAEDNPKLGMKTFIGDQRLYIDYCNNPSLMSLNNELLNDRYWGSNPLRPIVGNCRLAHSEDLVGAPSYMTLSDAPFVPWSEKDFDKLHWRGRATGLPHHAEAPWRQSQRDRLHMLAQNDSLQDIHVLAPVASQNADDRLFTVSTDQLNKAWLDIGLIEEQNGCNVDDGTCDIMKQEYRFSQPVDQDMTSRCKFVMDVDGNAWSGRFRRLLSGNSVVFKSTIYPEWYSLVPWYHYVPIQYDYSDIYDVLAFFKGTYSNPQDGHDDLGEIIAMNGYRFTQDQWRIPDMQSFWYLLILEYWRLLSEDRLDANYKVARRI